MHDENGIEIGPEVPFPESYWVRPGRLLAGEHPLSSNPDESFRRVSLLADFSIRHIVDLTEPFEDKRFGPGFLSYELFIKKVCKEKNITITISRFPIPDFGAPNTRLMTRILDDIDSNISENRPVYVHCRAGIGRTGTVVGCYLVRHDNIMGIEALDAIDSMRRQLPSHFIDSPQSLEQIEMVLSFLS